MPTIKTPVKTERATPSEEARIRLREHFQTTSTEEFEDNIERFCSPIEADRIATQSDNIADTFETGQLILFQPQPAHLPLDAYLASALTGLSHDQRQLIFHISDMVSEECKRHDIELYEPRKKTDPVHHADVADADVFRVD